MGPLRRLADKTPELSEREAELLARLQLSASQYLSIKATLVQEALKAGALSKERSRALLQIDAVKSDGCYEFFVRSGWMHDSGAKEAAERADEKMPAVKSFPLPPA